MSANKPKLYVTAGCPYCVALKNFLEQKEVEFEEIDVSDNQEAARMIEEETGQIGVPVLEKDGKFVVGFNKEKIVEMLGL